MASRSFCVDDLLGMPDLLRKEMGGYVPGDIKSGAGEEGGGEDSNGKPKLHYAVQLALYVDILERLGLAAGRSLLMFLLKARRPHVYRERVAHEGSSPVVVTVRKDFAD
jgi:hypothetical protein